MEKMSDLSKINQIGNFLSDMPDMFFLPKHYEGVGENQGKIFAGHYEGAKIFQGDFSFAEKHYEKAKISQGIFMKEKI